MTVHHLKVRPPFYPALMSGAKTFELRRNDRDFHCGDTLVLEELDEHGEKTGHSIQRHVTQILHSFTDKGDKAIGDGFCIMSLAQPLTPVEEGVPSGSGWLPIESAPRDATILIAVERANGLPMRLGSQHMVYPAYVDDDGRFCNSGDWEPSTGFSGHFRPTHWMPLPPAPGEAPTPSLSEREKKLEALLREHVEAYEGLELAEVNHILGDGPDEAVLNQRAITDAKKRMLAAVMASKRALLSDTEGE